MDATSPNHTSNAAESNRTTAGSKNNPPSSRSQSVVLHSKRMSRPSVVPFPTRARSSDDNDDRSESDELNNTRYPTRTQRSLSTASAKEASTEAPSESHRYPTRERCPPNRLNIDSKEKPRSRRHSSVGRRYSSSTAIPNPVDEADTFNVFAQRHPEYIKAMANCGSRSVSS
ncbi:hypothetical protein PENTCL1PPCAC_20132, partial [Pristionchus entomophagus]